MGSTSVALLAVEQRADHGQHHRARRDKEQRAEHVGHRPGAPYDRSGVLLGPRPVTEGRLVHDDEAAVGPRKRGGAATLGNRGFGVGTRLAGLAVGIEQLPV